MKKIYVAKNRAIICLSFIASLMMLKQGNLYAQTKISDYVVFGGWNSSAGVNAVDMSGSVFTGGGAVGSAQSIRTTGSLNLTGSIFSAGKILFSSNNRVTGSLTAASGSNPVLQTGTGLNIGGNVDVNGNISIGGGVITGTITQPLGSTISPTSFTSTKAAPNLPVLPSSPDVNAALSGINLTASPNITSNETLTPATTVPAGSGMYKDMILTGNRTVTFSGVGTYYINSIKNSGNSNTFIFDFKSAQTGSIKIYIKGDVNLDKSKVQIINGGSATRIYTEVQGTGSTNTGGYAWRHDNGTSGTNNSQWAGTIWTPNGDIFIGSGPQNSNYTGALWSGKRVILGGSFNMAYAPWIGEPVAPVKSNLSDIIIKEGYVYPNPEISYVNFQASNITFDGKDNIELAKFTVRDGGQAGDPDNFATTLNTLVFNITNSINIKRIAIYDEAGNELGETSGVPTVTFSGLNLTAADNAGKDFSIRASFNTSVINENQNIILTVADGTSAAAAGSGFARSDAGGVSTSETKNKILVIIPDYDFPPGGKTQKLVVSPELSSICDDNSTLKEKIIAAGGLSEPEYFDPLTGSIINRNPLRDTYIIEGDGQSADFTSIYIEVVALASTNLSTFEGYLRDNYQMDVTGFNLNLTNSLKITGKVSLTKLCSLINDPDVISKSDDIIPLYPATKNLEFSVLNKGFANSNGDTAMGTNKLREGYGLSGDGIKIGILSDSYDKNQAVRRAQEDIGSNDLPQAGVTLIEGTEVYNFRGTDEGRAMAQIIYDVAPKAGLYFRTGFRNADDFALGIRQLKDAGCTIIVDDITYYTQPFFRDGVVAQMVNNVVGEGVAYFSAAGNFGNKAYDGVFKPLNATPFAPLSVTSQPNGSNAKAHNFSNAGEDLYQKIRLKKGSYTLVLQWDDDVYSMGEKDGIPNTGAKKDLDIYLTDEAGNIEFGFNKNNFGRDPVEVMPFTVLEDDVETNVLITDALGNATGTRFKYIVFRGRTGFTFVEEQYSGTYASTLVGHPNAAGAITVGAVRSRKDGSLAIESFSSPGGTGVTSATDTRNKPDIVAPNGGNNTFLGPIVKFEDFDIDGNPNFFGTSAAAPHAAGAAALLLEAKAKFSGVTMTSSGTLTPETIRQLLKQDAKPVSNFVPVENGQDALLSAGSSGLIQPEAVVQTFANAKPKIVSDGITIIPQTDGTIRVEVKGQYLDPNTTLKIGDKEYTKEDGVGVDETLTTVFIIRDPIVGDPEFRLYTRPQSTLPEPLDGGFSDPVKLSDSKNRQTVTVRTLPDTKKFGEILPDFKAEVTVTRLSETEPNAIVTVGTYQYPFTATNMPPAELGLDKLSITTLATNLSPVGEYDIKPILPANTNAVIYTSDEEAKLTITPMPIRISAYQKKNDANPLRYGQPIRDIGFIYFLDESKLGDEKQKKEFRIAVMIKHQRGIYQNKYAIISDRALAQRTSGGNPVGLQLKDLENLTALANEDVILNTEDVILNGEDVILNGEDVILNGEDVILNGEDVILNNEVINPAETFSSTNPSTKNYLTNISLSSFFKFLPTNDNDGIAVNMEDVILNNEDVILNGEDVILNTEDVILNNEDVILNNEDVILNTEDVILNGEDIILNGVFLNTEDVILNTEDVILNNDGLVSIEDIILNTEDVILNTEDVILNTEDVILNTEDIILNTEDVILNTSSSSILTAVNNMGAGGFNDSTVINGVSNDNVMVLFNATKNNNSPATFSRNVSPITVLTGIEAGRHYIIPPAFFNENFLVSYQPGELKILPAIMTVKANVVAETAIYGTTLNGLDVDVKANSNWYKKDKPSDVIESIGAILEKKEGSDYNPVDKTVTIPGVGDYQIKPVIKLKEIKNATGTITYDPNYILSFVEPNDIITISPKPVTVTVDYKEKVYDKNTETPVLTYTVPEGALITGDGFSGSLTREANENVGTYAITQGSLTLGDNYALTVTPNTLKITAKAVTVTADNKEKVYDKVPANPALTYTVPAGAVLSGDGFNGSLTRSAGENAGTYTDAIIQGSLTLGNNYALTVTPGTLKIIPKAITVTADNKEKVYDKVPANPALTYTVPAGAVLSGDGFTGSLTRTAVEDAGTYAEAITNGGLTLGDNYALTVTPGTLKILPKAITVTADYKEKVYDKDPSKPVLTYTVPAGAVLSGDGFSGSLTRSAVENAGTYTDAITKGGLTLGNNYALTVTPGTLKINKATLTVKAEDKTWTDDQALPASTSTFWTRTVSGFISGESVNNVAIGATTYTVPGYRTGKFGEYRITTVTSSTPAPANYTIVDAGIINGVDNRGKLYVNDDRSKRVTTALNCVQLLSAADKARLQTNFDYMAKFTYNNPNSTFVYVPLGARNFLTKTGATEIKDPPTLFNPGNGTFDILFDGAKLTWVLVTNSENSNTTSTSSPEASSASPRCAISGAAANGQIQPGNQMVDQTLSENKYAVYPNPASGRLTVTSALQSLKASDIAVYDLQGKLYRITTSRQVSANKVELDISSLASGVYMVRVNTGAENKVFRIVKQ